MDDLQPVWTMQREANPNASTSTAASNEHRDASNDDAAVYALSLTSNAIFNC